MFMRLVRAATIRERPDSALRAPATIDALVVVIVFVLVLILVFVFIFIFVFILVIFFFIQLAALGQHDAVGELAGLLRFGHHFFLFADAGAPEPEQHFVEQEHALFAAGLNAGIDAVRFVLAD